MSEYIRVLIGEVSNPCCGLFNKTKEGHLMPHRFSDKIPNYKQLFRMVGRLIGKFHREDLLSTPF